MLVKDPWPRLVKLVGTARQSVNNLDGLLNNRTCALKYHLINSDSPNLQVSSSAS